ncbi:CppA N-terminal domain-containing protein [Streptococcus sp.]|uniref:CppA N-terminal domain-containing protein n=1 Tax=Streptococcus sp. TaxID=1306 RepID=UPI0035A0E3EA
MLEVENVIVPALRINNRSVNQTFLEEVLGLKTVLEEGPFAEFAGHSDSKEAKLVLIESPSMRTRAVEGPKKLARLALKVAKPAEIESLLARGASFSKLYRGKRGLAFETVLPEGYVFLLHSEDDMAGLQEILPLVQFEELADFQGLTEFVVSQILINSPHPETSQGFYQTIWPDQDLLVFQEAQGPDLLADADSTWDLDSLRIKVQPELDWAELEEKLPAGYFKDRKERFLQSTDPSKIEIWFEK